MNAGGLDGAGCRLRRRSRGATVAVGGSLGSVSAVNVSAMFLRSWAVRTVCDGCAV